tara:strand:- start:145 stop:807 length:663 start_codon:yes stop_codon:yes gene_type:complete
MDFMNNFKNLIILYFIILSSCAGGDIYSELFTTINTVISGPKDISADKINSIPYASVQVRLGNGQNTLMVLEEENQGVLKWTSSNLIKMYTKNGFIKKFKGLENELDNIELDKFHPIEVGNFELQQETFTSFYTFNNPKLYRLPVKTKIRFIRKEKLKILDNLYETKIYEEESLNNLISWNFKNLYWVNSEGTLVKSEQTFTPRNPKITILYTKMYEKPE